MHSEIRLNGTGPAWPLLLESPSAFYRPEDLNALGSASYSIINYSDADKKTRGWELLIDAGHNTVPFLLNHGNQIPDAIFLTHGHPDHVLGVDWIVQSHHFKHYISNRKIPIYCTRGVWNTLMKTYSYIESYVLYKELIPGRKQIIDEAPGITVTTYPVFHGQGAQGASMLYFEPDESTVKKVLISGDMLCPLIPKKHLKYLTNADLLFIDANNRFPHPESNHTSFTRAQGDKKKIATLLHGWFEKTEITNLISPHRGSNDDISVNSYFNEFLSDWADISQLPHTILDLLHHIPIPDVYLIHYWGVYDQILYNEEILNALQLEQWANKLALEDGLKKLRVHVPKAGDSFQL